MTGFQGNLVGPGDEGDHEQKPGTLVPGFFVYE
jgi:hypothetical protein